jgi:REP element-mobilizing transposase RayT
MPRALRIEFEGALYHVMARGQRRAAIVLDDEDRERWVSTLEETVKRSGWKLFAYALMGNHYHLLIETPQATLVAGMQWLQSAYATRYRLRHGLVGSVFAGRYKALLIEPDGRRLGTVMDYIHLNGWRASQATLSAGLQRTPWCSLQWYGAEAKRRPGWVAVSDGLRWLELADTAVGRRAFIERIEERARLGTRRGDEPREEELNWRATLRRGWYYGGAEFRERILERAKALLVGQKDRSSVECEVRREVGEAEAARLLERGCTLWGWKERDLLKRPKGDRQKVILAWFIRRRTGVTLSWIQRHLHTGAPAATSRLLSGASATYCSPRQTRRWIADLEEISK